MQKVISGKRAGRLLVAGLLAHSFFLRPEVAGLRTVKLNPPDTKRGLPLMEALSVRASTQEWSGRELSLQDLSDLLWAANGINRADNQKRTAPSAMNAQDIDIYVFQKEGVYLYNAARHQLDPVAAGDLRSQIAAPRPPRPDETPPAGGAARRPPEVDPPAQLLLVSDTNRFRMGTPELKGEWGALDAGIVSQNISLFCAGAGLKTRPIAAVNKEKLKTLLNLKAGQIIFLNHPVGYPK